MGSLSFAVIIAAAGVSCLSLSHESRMVVPQVQSENVQADGSSGATFSPKQIRIPAGIGIGLDETATSDAATANCTLACERPLVLDSKSCKCVTETRSR